MKGYLFDTHVHTSESSTCGAACAEKVVAHYKELGYDGIVITDHMHAQNLGFRGDTYKEQAQNFLTGYRNAKALESDDFKVILGLEIRFLESDNDYLIYGVDEEFILSNDLAHYETLEDFVPFAKENGLIIIQAHPLRIGMVVSDPEMLDGIEVYNGNPNHNSRNDVAYIWAEKHSLLKTSGSDYHGDEGAAPGGVYFEELPKDSYDIVKLLREEKYSLKHFEQIK